MLFPQALKLLSFNSTEMTELLCNASQLGDIIMTDFNVTDLQDLSDMLCDMNVTQIIELIDRHTGLLNLLNKVSRSCLLWLRIIIL